MAKKNINVNAICNTLTDTAYVPDMTERQEELTQSQKLHNEAGDAVQKKPERGSIEIHLQRGYAGKPKNGEHTVKVVDVEAKSGRNGQPDYDIITLRDVASDVEWKTIVGYDRYQETIESVNYYNSGMFRELARKGKLNADTALDVMEKKQFKVWVQEKEGANSKILTYFNEDKYQKFCMAVAYNRTK